MTDVFLRLRPYQRQVYQDVLDSVTDRRGLTFTVAMARQGGKNELSAVLELTVLMAAFRAGGSLVKAAPTFNPQALISLRRLRERVADVGLAELWRVEGGNVVHLDRAQQTFLSADPSANVVGATADLLLEIDEAQDVDAGKFFKEFRPMGASGNATTVLYGTPWDGATLLETLAEEGLELERRDGLRRHFAFDWQAVAECSPDYAGYVETERQRLGDEHPLFRTQYRLLPVAPGEGMFSRSQLARLRGDHPRLRAPRPGFTYVAGVDVAGEPWGAAERPTALILDAAGLDGPAERGGRDATVVTVGELEPAPADPAGGRPDAPLVHVVEHYRWTGEPHHALTPVLADLLKRTWRCRRVVVDATGLGAGVASGLVKAMGAAVEPFVFTAASKSQLGFDLLGAVNSGRLTAYAGDGSPEFAEFWRELELAQARYRVNQTMDFFVEPSRGHDDYLMSLALMVRAAAASRPRAARGRLPDGPSP